LRCFAFYTVVAAVAASSAELLPLRYCCIALSFSELLQLLTFEIVDGPVFLRGLIRAGWPWRVPMKFATEAPPSPDSTGKLPLHGAQLKTPEELSEIVSRFAASGGWMDGVRLCAESRWYERVFESPSYDIWVISWLPGQSTGFHDHGESSGAFVVATGSLEEHRPGARPLPLHPGQSRAFGPDYTHDVRNDSFAPAISIHAYSPPLNEMNEYELDGTRLVRRRPEQAQFETAREEGKEQGSKAVRRTDAVGVEQMLSAARARLRRLAPREAYDAMAEGEAILVDIRPEGQRALEGEIPGAYIVERNVLEWRLDPASSSRLPVATSLDLPVIVLCSEGYTSSLAAAVLQNMGLWRATDIVGGFRMWRDAGLPVTEAEPRL
jgi:rhodanese-related sulfurtransferase/mannose-6-phosphate isomerase-like protein (cupin superfamily)